MIPAQLLHRAATANLCAYYRVRLVERFTQRTICDLTPLGAFGTFRWILSTTGFMDLSIPTRNNRIECCECFPRPWADEIVIDRRNPARESEGIVFRGVVTRTVEDQSNEVIKVSAGDGSIWWTRHDRARSTVDAVMDETDAWRAVVLDAERGAFSGVRVGPGTPTGVSTRLQLTAASATAEGSENQSLIFGGYPNVMWAIVDRTLYGPGSTTVGEEPHATLDTGLHWVQPGAEIDNDGADFASQIRLVGATVGGDTVIGVWPTEPLSTSLLGEHVRTYSQEGVFTQAEITEAARARWITDREIRQFLVTSEDSLSSTAPVTVWDCVPGRVFQVAASGACSSLGRLMRVYNVAVDFADSGDGRLAETRVAIDLRPHTAVGAVSYDRLSI